MNLPTLTGYFYYPTTAHYRTRGYFAAFPALLPIVAVIEYDDTNPFLSATATFDGQHVPVIVHPNRLEAKINARLTDAGRIIDLNWTLQFAETPKTITYVHRVLVTGIDNHNPIPTLFGNPCNLPCGRHTIAGTSTSLYFVHTRTAIHYEGFGFVTPMIDGNQVVDWCEFQGGGYIDIQPYTPSSGSGTANWEETNRFCVQNPPRTSSNAIIVEIDTHALSPTFGQVRTRIEPDPTNCPLGDTAPDWQDIGEPECQPEPRTDCRKQKQQIDQNPLSPTYGTVQTILLPPTPEDCEDCPPTSLLPSWQPTGEWRCKYPALGRESSEAEQKEIDRNPYSPTYNQERWVSIGNRPDLCPLDPDPCNREVWIDVLDESCNPITRCKFEPPRYESTRQKKQIQANPRLPNVGAIRWIDLPPSPLDATLCPVETCPIYVPVCPQQRRCKYEEPRISAVVEELQVDVNPHSPTFGQQIWVEIGENPTLCPIVPEASMISISSASPYAFAVPQDSNPIGCRQVWFFVRTDNFGLFDFSYDVNAPQTIKWRWDIDRTTYNDIRHHGPPNNLPYWIQMGLYTSDFSKFFDCWTRIDDVVHWARAYHAIPAGLVNLGDGTGQLFTSAWLSSLYAPESLTAELTLYDEFGNVLEVFHDDFSELTSPAPYEIFYVNQFTDLHCTVGWDYPHRNNQSATPEAIPDGYRLRYNYQSPWFVRVGLYRYQHDLFINNQLYASQSGWIRNLP